MSQNDKEAGFVSHLAELRKRLINSFIFLIIFFVGCYFFAEHLYGFLVEPYAKVVKDGTTSRRLIFTALHETFITYLKVAFFAAIFLGSPFLLIQIYKFIAPGLYKNEKKALLPYLICTPILFLIGAFNFLVVFVVERWQTAKFYRMPPNFGIQISLCAAHDLCDIGIMMFFSMGVWFYSNQQIFANQGS